MSLKATLEALLIETQRETAIREAQIRQALALIRQAEAAARAAEEAEITQAVDSVSEFLRECEWRALVDSLAVSYLPPPRPPPLSQL